ncbi:MAG: GPR endopeptidase [Hyphomonadaceae bacterium]|nr:GPR endopeptidase [Clostridia bacterium]
MRQIRTDLAIEAGEIFRANADQTEDIPGVRTEMQKYQDVTITRVFVENEMGERAIGKAKGTYVTLEAPRMRENDDRLHEKIADLFSVELKNIAKLTKKDTVLVVGLGNWHVTPDALGPKVTEGLIITRHLLQYDPNFKDSDVRAVCGISPGVLGITGVETMEVVKGVVERVKPTIVMVIDALASRKMERVSSTIQIADTGISPGSGVGNKRMALNQETLGVKVIAIGVPTVVDAATIANDTIDLLLDNMQKENAQDNALTQTLKNINRDDKYDLILQSLAPFGQQLIVTPNDVDSMIDRVSNVISDGINVAMHGKDAIPHYE